MSEPRFKYTAYMPMDDERNIVHVMTQDLAKYRFVSFERTGGVVGSVKFPVKGREDILVVYTHFLDKWAIREILAQIHNCRIEDIDLQPHMDLWLTVSVADR